MTTMFGSNIKHLLSITGVRNNKLADAAGVSNGTVGDWLSGKSQGIDGDNLIKVANFFAVRPEQLMHVDLTQLVREDLAHYSVAPLASLMQRVPVAGTAKLGEDGFYDTLQDDFGGGDGHVVFPTRDRDAYALRVEGDSMRPRFKPGEYVVVEPSRAPEPGHEVVVKTTDGRTMVKVFDWRRGGRVQLGSVNEMHPPISFSESAIEKMHRVVGVVQADLYQP